MFEDLSCGRGRCGGGVDIGMGGWVLFDYLVGWTGWVGLLRGSSWEDEYRGEKSEEDVCMMDEWRGKSRVCEVRCCSYRLFPIVAK